MRYETIVEATFLSRPNRFLAVVRLEGRELTVHVKNTGRCKELLVPGARVYLSKSANPARKTAYDLVAVWKGPRLVNMDSAAPNRLFAEWAWAGHFRPGLSLLRPETTWGDSRFDFYWEGGGERGFVEVKGCTLEREGWTWFPDAPTLRGVKHLEELRRAKAEGFRATVCFVIQMAEVDGFSPNDQTHPEFGDALRRCEAAGVEILALSCKVSPGEIAIVGPVSIKL